MVDETTDIANIEQVVICLRWVSALKYMKILLVSTKKIFSTIKDVFLRLNLAILKVHGQCYDGASAVSGTKSGVVKKMCDAEPRAVYTHCYGHAACGDTIRHCKLMRDALDTTHPT